MGGPVIDVVPDQGAALVWTTDANERVRRIPPFVRQFVRQRAEVYAKELGDDLITLDHLHVLAKRRFAGARSQGGCALPETHQGVR